MGKKLSKQEALFAQNYVLTRNGRQSAILAGYSESNASAAAYRLLQRDRIAQEIKRLDESSLSERNVTKPSIEAFYVGLMVDKTLTPDQRMKAADLLCKLKGYYMRSLDKLLSMGPEEIRQAVREVQETILTTYRLSDGK